MLSTRRELPTAGLLHHSNTYAARPHALQAMLNGEHGCRLQVPAPMACRPWPQTPSSSGARASSMSMPGPGGVYVRYPRAHGAVTESGCAYWTA